MQQQRIQLQGHPTRWLNGAASNLRFVQESPDAAETVMDCNHWHDPRKEEAQALRARVESDGNVWTYNIPLNYSNCEAARPDAIGAGPAPRAHRDPRRARRVQASRTTHALRPDVPFVDGPEPGARRRSTPRSRAGNIKVIFPDGLSGFAAEFLPG